MDQQDYNMWDEESNLIIENVPIYPNDEFLNQMLVEDLVSHLNYVEKQVIHQKFYLDKSIQQIARENKIPEGRVKKYLEHALLKMNRVYRYQNPTEEIPWIGIDKPIYVNKEKTLKIQK